MRPTCLLLLFALTNIPVALPQVQTSAPPQTARQALLEMFINPKPGALEKHLPEVTRKMLLRGGDASNSDILREFVSFSAGFSANQKHFETFDVGPILLSMEPAPGGLRVEIVVERDDLQGDSDEIELSVRLYKEGQLGSLPVLPRFTFTLNQEKEVWKLNEMAVTLRMPLGDPEYLKGLVESEKKDSERRAIGDVGTVNAAEISYASQFPQRGYTCKLAELGGTSGQPNPDHAMLIDDALASGQKNGYVFAINGCDARPASRYQATAVPADPELGMRAFCSDEKGAIRYATDGKASTCLSEGVPLPLVEVKVQ